MSYYSETVYRPPSEANSLILRITRGCSHNQCTFCTMYKDRPYEIRPLDTILGEIKQIKGQGYSPRRVFLADGNALSLPTSHLLQILHALKATFLDLERITAYAAPLDIGEKSVEDLSALHEAGLEMVYMGLESGSDKILKAVNKGVCALDFVRASQKLHAARIKMSVTVISGLGGQAHWQEHALETAAILNKMQPHYLGLLTLMLEPPSPMYTAWKNKTFDLLSPQAVLMETKVLLEHLHLDHCVFRSNHASNYFGLMGFLPEDKPRLISEIDLVIKKGDKMLRPEWYRGL